MKKKEQGNSLASAVAIDPCSRGFLLYCWVILRKITCRDSMQRTKLCIEEAVIS